MASRLVVDPVRLIALPGIFLLDGPWFRPRGCIFYCDGVLERVWARACPAFDQMAVLAGCHEVRLGAEIGHIDHQRFALPLAPRIATAPPGRARVLRRGASGDKALSPLAL